MRSVLAVISMLGFAAACTVEPQPESMAEIPEAVQRAFDGTCVEAGCHDAEAGASGLSLVAGDSVAIIDGPSSQSELPLVEVGSLSGSYMAIKLLPDSQLPSGTVREGEPMPLGGYGEGDVDNVNTILSWIAGHGPSGGGTSAGTDGSATDDGSGEGTGDGSDEGTDAGTSGDDDPSNSDGGPSFPRCSVEGVTAGMVSSPLDKGDVAGKFPVVVGEALEASCGCHTLADRNLNTELPGLLPPGNTLFLQYSDMSRGVGGTTLGLLMEDEVFGSFGMPPGSCPTIPADDTDVLREWFQQGLPDGADFVPP